MARSSASCAWLATTIGGANCIAKAVKRLFEQAPLAKQREQVLGPLDGRKRP